MTLALIISGLEGLIQMNRQTDGRGDEQIDRPAEGQLDGRAWPYWLLIYGLLLPDKQHEPSLFCSVFNSNDFRLI